MKLLLICLCLYMLPTVASAQEFQDPATSNWFKSLKGLSQNGESYSCCDQSDCHPTQAAQVNGIWIVRSEYGKDGETIPIPPEKILPGKVSPFSLAGVGLGVLCEAMSAGSSAKQATGSMGTQVMIYCFVVPPNFS